MSSLATAARETTLTDCINELEELTNQMENHTVGIREKLCQNGIRGPESTAKVPTPVMPILSRAATLLTRLRGINDQLSSINSAV